MAKQPPLSLKKWSPEANGLASLLRQCFAKKWQDFTSKSLKQRRYIRYAGKTNYEFNFATFKFDFPIRLPTRIKYKQKKWKKIVSELEKC